MASKKGVVAGIVGMVLGVLLVDQVSKILVKTSMRLGECIDVFGWWKICFVENPGMAFGMTIGSKLLLTGFRVVLIGFIIYYLVKLVKKGHRTSYLLCLSAILAGAIGNVIDCMFYGLVFTESTPMSVASWTLTEGYAPFFQGKVVDMLYFPLFTFPEGWPIVGGEVFFSPVFNVADSAISVGIVALLLFFRKDFEETLDTKKKVAAEEKNEEA